MLTFLKQNIFSVFILLLVLFLTLFIRWNNLQIYTTWWADDGGGHLDYVKTILDHSRLPSKSDTYIAWHEPLYYIVLTGWVRFGELINTGGLNWWEGFNILVFLCFAVLVFLVSYCYTNKNYQLALVNTFLFSIIFSTVKLSAFVNNEIFAQTLILLSVFLFFSCRLLETHKLKGVLLWSLIVGLAALTKLTGIIIFLAACVIWLLAAITEKKWHYVYYILISACVILFVNFPWLIHKQNTFGKIFSINLYEEQTKQNIFQSDGWGYIWRFNTKTFTSQPYWENTPHAFWSILISDMFADHYNLFNNVDAINALPDSQKIETSNGRFTTRQLTVAMLWANRLGLVIFLTWAAGACGWLILSLKRKRVNPSTSLMVNWYQLFLCIVVLGGFAALIYNNLRHPYLDRGVLKGSFILFAFPLLAALSYYFWYNTIKTKWARFLLLYAPPILYLIAAWPILVIT